MNPLLLQALFLAVPLILTVLMVLTARWAIRRGYLVERKQPTELELAMDRLRTEIDAAAAAIGQALLPGLQKVATAMQELAEAVKGWRTE
jgi:hypothetical protein